LVLLHFKDFIWGLPLVLSKLVVVPKHLFIDVSLDLFMVGLVVAVAVVVVV
jgi:hypothetical protein